MALVFRLNRTYTGTSCTTVEGSACVRFVDEFTRRGALLGLTRSLTAISDLTSVLYVIKLSSEIKISRYFNIFFSFFLRFLILFNRLVWSNWFGVRTIPLHKKLPKNHQLLCPYPHLHFLWYNNNCQFWSVWQTPNFLFILCFNIKLRRHEREEIETLWS